MFELARIRDETFVRTIEYHDSLDSTSVLAVELLNPLLQDAPALVLTASQTAGKGRGSNRWWATTGALTFTVVLDADAIRVPVERRAMVALASGLATRNAVARLVPERPVFIKWPNDVLIGEQKVGGILTEHHVAEDRSALIIGIGVNVNNSLGDAPAEVRQRAASVFDCSGDSHNLTSMLVDVLQQLDSTLQLLADSPDEIVDQINSQNILKGRMVTVDVNGTPVQGVCQYVDAEGQLVLSTGAGLRRLSAGSVESWEPAH
jgi:BirA family biotin operon repressor/biotin-[acetyl-CoA-carboxylase] ligase